MTLHSLPDSFVNRIKTQLGSRADSFFEIYAESPCSGLSVNTLKIAAEDFARSYGWVSERVPWNETGFYATDMDFRASKHTLYHAGLYYIQEPSAMLPAALLPVEPGDKVLDLCAAPGGKSVQLAAKLNGTGLLVSNDISVSRTAALMKNIEMCGAANVLVTSENPVKLATRFEGYFDKILVDAPCSGEGMFRKDPKVRQNYRQYGVEYYAKLQRQILPFAVGMLKPGGVICYSTCTFAPAEDEEMVEWLISEYVGLSVLKTVKLWPDEVRGEGHFAAVIKKEDQGAVGAGSVRAIDKGSNNQRLISTRCHCGPDPQSMTGKVKQDGFLRAGRNDRGVRLSPYTHDFLSLMRSLFFESYAQRVALRGDKLYLPAIGANEEYRLEGLRVIRNGLLLGEQKDSRFVPSQALAMALKAEDYDNFVDMPADSEAVDRYLRCESIQPPAPVNDGYVLMCADGFPLGWAYAKKDMFKNRYLPSWRRM
jgi:NOL1/NOP2/sun family putative RNA methylase